MADDNDTVRQQQAAYSRRSEVEGYLRLLWGLKTQFILDEISTPIASDKNFDPDPQIPDQSLNQEKNGALRL